MKRIIVFVMLLGIAACNQRGPRMEMQPSAESATTLRYAEGFRVWYQEGGTKLVEVTYPYQEAKEGYKYLLVPRGREVPDHDPETKVIQIPLQSIACTSTTHIPMLDYLGESNKLTGFTSTQYVSTPAVRERIDQGKVMELGMDKDVNLERLAILKPDILMGYSLTGDYAQFRKIEQLGVPVVINAEYLEKHPLGRAEWLKFVALFFNQEKAADSIFSAIEKEYLEAARSAAQVARRPTVLTGIVYSDAWIVPGGKNYAATLLKDAGCDYLWKDDTSHGFLQLSFESVFEKAHDADLWIGAGSFNSLKELEAADRRYTRFRPFKERQVYTSNARMGATGGSEYLELGYLRPDIILKDLIRIGHPELLEGYALYFHRRME